MGPCSALGSLLIFLRICGTCAEFVTENCTEHKLQFERVLSVPGDMAMLSSTLVSPYVFDLTTIPYNITWYVSKTGKEMSNQTGRILILGETLWFLNVTLDDDGEYVAIVRTPGHCYRQASTLMVTVLIAGQCGRPHKTTQSLTGGVNDKLSCPMMDNINKLNSYNVATSLTWYKGCHPIINGEKYTYSANLLMIHRVTFSEDNSPFTCTLKFTLGGITGSISETITASVKDEYSLPPQVHEPANEVAKAQIGASFSKRCLVFVQGKQRVYLVWFAGDIRLNAMPAARIYVSKKREWNDASKKGVWMELMLVISKLTEKDFHINYTCRAHGQLGYFTLLPADPNIIIPIGSVLGGAMVLFAISVVIYHIFKIDIVLWLRSVFPVLYTNKDLDGRLYDAYVAYPEPCAVGWSQKVEKFALHTLPQVLENACGYKLFIADRDCQPGQAVIDSVEKNIQTSRCLLLVYTASTFTSKQHMSSNIAESGNTSDNRGSKSNNGSCTSFGSSDKVYPDMRQQLECVAGMHSALLKGSLKVVLVELEEITPAQLALFPESVRHLRKKQGAVCWWKNTKKRQRWRTCTNSGEDEETCGQDTQWSPSLSPSSRFWKELRYHMPVRGKRVTYPEKTALLDI